MKLDGTGLERVNRTGPQQGTHEVSFSPGAKYYVDEWSDFYTPPETVLYRVDGSRVRTVPTSLDEPAPEQARQNQQSKTELFKVKAPDGVILPATVTLPPNVDKQKKYPVWLSLYGGPHMPQIRNAGGGGGGGADATKAAQGYIVFHMDPRSFPAQHRNCRGRVTSSWASKS